MKEDIKTKEMPKESGAYLFKVNDEIIYVGSTNNLNHRLGQHKYCIKAGNNNNRQKDFYAFLQLNPFTVEYILEENYKELEEQLIEQYHPRFNANKAFSGCGKCKGREKEYMKEWQAKNREHFLDYKNKYNNQKCNYNGKEITLNALMQKFFNKGVEHPTKEAKKYLIKEEE